MTDTLTTGSEWLLPVTITEQVPEIGAVFVRFGAFNRIVLDREGLPALIPASRLTDLEAEVARLREALQPFAEAAEHLHPSQPDDGLTLDAIKVSEWRAAWSVLNIKRTAND